MVKEVPLQNGMVALVDDEDYERVMKHNWVVSKNSISISVATSIERKTIHLNRFIKLDVKENQVVIYKDRNPLNCQKSNLEVSTAKERSFIRRGGRNTSSKYKGVSWSKGRGKWLAQIKIEGKPKYLGRFKEEEEAARAYNEAARKYFGRNAYLNKIGKDNSATEVKLETKTKAGHRINKNIKSSKYRGVSWHGKSQKWQARIGYPKRIHIGIYSTEEEAARAYDEKAIELYGDKAVLNFPDCKGGE